MPKLSTRTWAAIGVLSILALLCMWLAFGGGVEFLQKFLPASLAFLLLGVTGAIFANSTGAGGGVVFIPWFNFLGLSEIQSVSTSFGIQCFGMTAGAINWSRSYWHQHHGLDNPASEWQSFPRIIVICSFFSIVGIWAAELFHLPAPASLHRIFGIFSIILGLLILITVLWQRQSIIRYRITSADAYVLGMLSFFGGILTAWLSVGVGEIIAFYLIFRRYQAMMAVASAVVITAFTVWSVAPIHMASDSAIQWQIVAYAGPGAILGGFCARYLVEAFSARRLKIFFGLWVLLVGLMS